MVRRIKEKSNVESLIYWLDFAGTDDSEFGLDRMVRRSDKRDSNSGGRLTGVLLPRTIEQAHEFQQSNEEVLFPPTELIDDDLKELLDGPEFADEEPDMDEED